MLVHQKRIEAVKERIDVPHNRQSRGARRCLQEGVDVGLHIEWGLGAARHREVEQALLTRVWQLVDGEEDVEIAGQQGRDPVLDAHTVTPAHGPLDLRQVRGERLPQDRVFLAMMARRNACGYGRTAAAWRLRYQPERSNSGVECRTLCQKQVE